MSITQSLVDSPLGPLRILATEAAVTSIWLPPLAPSDVPFGDHAVHRQAARELTEYFGGSRTSFDLPLAPRGTEFQQAVWGQLRSIPFGETRSYADIARALGQPTATRAVGAANGKNPIAIVVPCHRVIGADGSLTGYAGGLPTKSWLLRHEGLRPIEQTRLPGLG